MERLTCLLNGQTAEKDESRGEAEGLPPTKRLKALPEVGLSSFSR